ncbi:MAG: prepilin-type N-terminal cleavage/methylation domain-containing protein [Pseudomonadota bacterium]
MTQRGFSLLEAVIALAIGSYAVIGAYQAFAGGLKNLADARADAQAAIAAETVLLETPNIAWRVGEAGGETDQGVRWTVVVTPYVEAYTGEDGVSVPAAVSDDLLHVRIEADAGARTPFVLETLVWSGGDG